MIYSAREIHALSESIIYWTNRLILRDKGLIHSNLWLVTTQIEKFVNTVKDGEVISCVSLKGFIKIFWESKRLGTMVLYILSITLVFYFSGIIFTGCLLSINYLDHVSYLYKKFLNLKCRISQWKLPSVHLPQFSIPKPSLFYISLPTET